jgi:arginase
MDVLDPSVVPGVGTPVRGGFTYREAQTVMEAIARSYKLASLEVVETNPILDVRNSTAQVAADLIQSAMGKRIL